MSVPILTAVSDAAFEADLTSGLSADDYGLQVVRRCVDLADLLAASAAGLARAVVLSADLRRLDREALSRLAQARVAVVGLIPVADDSAEHRLHQLGIVHVLSGQATAAEVSAAVHASISDLAGPPLAEARPDSPEPIEQRPVRRFAVAAELPEHVRGSGRIVAVWGPAGSPGRSTIAVNLAAELAAMGHSTLLVDADTYGGVVAQLIGVLDEAPGVAAACRLANGGTLDARRLAGVALEVRPALRVLTGITRADRWLELRPSALMAVLEFARSLAVFTVIDLGFCLEQDEELSYDTAAPRRNGATLVALEAADIVVGVAAADPVGLTRYVRARPECVELAGSASWLTVANRLRRGVVGPGDPRRQVVAALDRYAGISGVHLVPEDREALDTALAIGRTLAEAAPKSPARIAIRDLAAQLVGDADRKRRRRRR